MKVTIEYDPLSPQDWEAAKAMFATALTAPAETAKVVEEEPVKPKRKRRTKAEIEADNKKAEEEAKAASEPDPTLPASSDGYDYAAAKADLLKIRDAENLGLQIVVKILKEVGINKVDDLQEKTDLLPKVQELCAVALA